MPSVSARLAHEEASTFGCNFFSTDLTRETHCAEGNFNRWIVEVVEGSLSFFFFSSALLLLSFSFLRTLSLRSLLHYNLPSDLLAARDAAMRAPIVRSSSSSSS